MKAARGVRSLRAARLRLNASSYSGPSLPRKPRNHSSLYRSLDTLKKEVEK